MRGLTSTWLGLLTAFLGCGDSDSRADTTSSGSGGSSTSKSASSGSETATGGTTTGQETLGDISVVNLNILHGLFCPPDTKYCRLSDRVDLLFELIKQDGCPDVITLQEVFWDAAPLIAANAPTACPFPYQVVLGRDELGPDEEMVLSRYPVSEFSLTPLHGGFRTVLLTRIDHPRAKLDLYSTHLASSADGATNPCGDNCPAECTAAGAQNVRQCQGVQLTEMVKQMTSADAIALVAGDFNETPASWVYKHMTAAGFIDTYLAAGQPECSPATGAGCTGGRDDGLAVLDALQSPTATPNYRIDYIFMKPGATECKARVDDAANSDQDSHRTALFSDQPAPNCGAAPAPPCWVSDHAGVQLDLNCD